MGRWKAVGLPSGLGRSALPETRPQDLPGCLRACHPTAFRCRCACVVPLFRVSRERSWVPVEAALDSGIHSSPCQGGRNIWNSAHWRDEGGCLFSSQLSLRPHPEIPQIRLYRGGDQGLGEMWFLTLDPPQSSPWVSDPRVVLHPYLSSVSLFCG